MFKPLFIDFILSYGIQNSGPVHAAKYCEVILAHEHRSRRLRAEAPQSLRGWPWWWCRGLWGLPLGACTRPLLCCLRPLEQGGAFSLWSLFLPDPFHLPPSAGFTSVLSFYRVQSLFQIRGFSEEVVVLCVFCEPRRSLGGFNFLEDRPAECHLVLTPGV